MADRSYALTCDDGSLFLNISTPIQAILQGNAQGLSWTGISSAGPWQVSYTQDDFQTVLTLETAAAALDTFGLPAGSFQWQVCSGSSCYQGEDIRISGTTIRNRTLSGSQ